MSDADQPKRRRFHCNSCDKQTWHASLWSDVKQQNAADYEEWTIDFAIRSLEIWECQGCEDVFLLEAWVTSEDPDPVEDFYPERAARRVTAKKYQGLSSSLECIYEESIEAFNANCPLLSAAGLRALLEGICDDKGLPGSRKRTLKDKIESLKQWVTASAADNLHGLRFMGNEALHRLTVPDSKDIALAIEVMEGVMTAIYELDYKSGRLFQLVMKGRSSGSRQES